jgi:hypothetical protein
VTIAISSGRVTSTLVRALSLQIYHSFVFVLPIPRKQTSIQNPIHILISSILFAFPSIDKYSRFGQ